MLVGKKRRGETGWGGGGGGGGTHYVEYPRDLQTLVVDLGDEVEHFSCNDGRENELENADEVEGRLGVGRW